MRIGAILSLERIAQDSTTYDSGRDHVRVMEILCAYLRENSPAEQVQNGSKTPKDDGPETAPNKKIVELSHLLHKPYLGQPYFSPVWRWAHNLPNPRADTALVLRVLGRRSKEQLMVEAAWPNPPNKDTIWPFDNAFPEPPKTNSSAPRSAERVTNHKENIDRWKNQLSNYSGYRLNLSNLNLQRADMSAILPDGSDAVFSGATFEGTYLDGADLTRTRLEGAKLLSISLTGATLNEARLQGAALNPDRMEAATFSRAKLQGADLRAANMHGAILADSDLTAAFMFRVDLRDANLTRAKLEATVLNSAQISNAILDGATFDSITDWTNATLQGAAVQHCNFSATRIAYEQITTTFGDGSTALPAGMARPAHWPKATLGFFEFDNEYNKWRENPAAYAPPAP